MGEALGQLLPLAVAIAVFPIPIVAIVLLLASPHGTSNGLAFVAGWVVGLLAVGALVLALAGEEAHTDAGQPSTAANVLRLVVGLALIVLGVRALRGRPSGGEPAELPGWMRAMDDMRWPRALGAGLLLSAANPKNVLLVVAGATTIAAADLPAGQAIATLALFVLVASLGVAAPLALHLALGERVRGLLDAVRGWLSAHSTVIVAVLMLVIGTMVLGAAISGFAA